MFFSPITARSWKVRLFFGALFIVLSLGALTMVLPFVVMVAGSLEPAARFTDSTFFPRYLIDRQALWQRYLEAKYHGTADFLRMAWNDPSADFRTAELPSPSMEMESESEKLWNAYLEEAKVDPTMQSIGFLRANRRMPAYYAREFKNWLLARYGGSLAELNRSLHTQIADPKLILPPFISLQGTSLAKTPYIEIFQEFSLGVSQSRKFVWDAGGYYRAVFLPRLIGRDIASFNKRYGTNYHSYAEVPFTATAQTVAADSWFLFVSRILRPDFVELTAEGELRFAESGLSRKEFIQLHSKPEDLRVVTLDRSFAEWAQKTHGVSSINIPQREIDWLAFQKEAGFWRSTFLSLNYLVVIDEILLNGRAIVNTLILVILSVGGALLINPLAAYALSRFRLRKTYHILLFCLATIAFPAEVTMIPVFLQMKEFNLLNTFGALVLPGLANGFSIFLLKGFFDSLPKELFEAAELDGASEWKMFWLITMNLSRPILAVIALGAFVSAYGTFFYALILAPDPKMWTVMVYIYQLRQSVDAPVVYASLILTAIPTLLVFIFCQNIILRGIVVPSDK